MANITLPDALALRTGATEAPPALVAAIIEQLICALDLADGDTDLEDSDEDHCGSEDDGEDNSGGLHGPGCPIADGPEFAYSEWQTRGRHKVYGEGHEVPQDIWTGAWHEDMEEDDGPDSSGDEAEPDFLTKQRDSCPGCAISDPDFCLAGDDRVTSGGVMGGAAYPSPGNGGEIGNEDDAEAEQWNHPEDCEEDVHIGQRRPARQLSPVHLVPVEIVR